MLKGGCSPPGEQEVESNEGTRDRYPLSRHSPFFLLLMTWPTLPKFPLPLKVAAAGTKAVQIAHIRANALLHGPQREQHVPWCCLFAQ